MGRPRTNARKPTEFGQWLYQSRMERGVTLNGLAERAGVSNAAISHYESGTRFPSKSMVVRLASSLGVNPNPGLLAAGFATGKPLAAPPPSPAIAAFRRRTADRVRTARESAGLTQEELGQRVGIGRGGITYWEKGEGDLAASDIVALSRALKVPISYFFDQNDRDEIAREAERIAKSMHALVQSVSEDAGKMAIARLNELAGSAEPASPAVVEVDQDMQGAFRTPLAELKRDRLTDEYEVAAYRGEISDEDKKIIERHLKGEDDSDEEAGDGTC
ncbi:MAG: helix-turn-helix transcriptional regulator [Patescibacteria group bacterium]|nr:helix-turn-helix transcriptional regulator [Patescibacteria group bacterium]